MQFVEPVRYRFTVPAERQVLRVVRDVILGLLLHLLHHVLVVRLLSLCVSSGLLPLHVLHGGVPDFSQQLSKPVDVGLLLGDIFQLVAVLSSLLPGLRLGENIWVEIRQLPSLG